MSRAELERLNEEGIGAWDRHDTDGFVKLLADDFVWIDDTTPDPMRTVEAARAYTQSWFTAFPDMHIRTTNMVCTDDQIACELEFTGTNTGTLAMGGMEIPPTGKSVTSRGTYFIKAENGKIKEFHTHPDAAGMMMQLGLMGQPA
ncbi:hypothetical protein Lesp02_61670 [Lentzea sp. NBRC 105346]|uniref:ester cyclase n=1 Tax=Lentzea sp. NBRC 105346 TaxID=3032205 RepID=UPI0025565434|nr:ester cyclase [Lentzea sp. NBRC 105346]GLZ33979.1 hypothetical protein Lesp02_61670 [Lentzea sp. NBRC 105346]